MIPRRSPPAAPTRSCSRRRTRRRASTRSCNPTSATTAAAWAIASSTASGRNSGSDKALWVEDTGRWFAGRDGKPARAHGVVRVINERYESERRLNYLARHDSLTGELNRPHLTEVLEKTLDEAMRFRSSCGFLLVAIDNLARINESYGFDTADQVIGAVAKRIRKLMRGKDTLGRFSGNKFGIVLRDCTPDDMAIAAERMLIGSTRRDGADRRRADRGDGDDRRRDGAAPCPHRGRGAGPRPGGARHREGQAPRLVLRLSAEYRARSAAPRKRARHRRDRRRAQRAADFPRLRDRGYRHQSGGRPFTNA